MEYEMGRFEQLSNRIFKRKLMGTLPVSSSKTFADNSI